MKIRNIKSVILFIFFPVLVLMIFGIAYAGTGYVDPTNKWAWGTNVGWINFAPSHGGMTVYDDHLEGYVWGENIGWIRLGSYEGGGTHTYANNAANTYGVNNDGSGNLSGYAWGTNVGWINFNPTHGGVTIDPNTGDFDGYAWGENIGWVHFKYTGTNAYKVAVTNSLIVGSNGIQSNGVDISNNGTIGGPVTSITVQFNKDVNDPTGNGDPDDVTNPANYLLIQKGIDGVYDTQGCSPPGFHVDDILVPTGPVSYSNNGGGGPFIATVTVNSGVKLPDGEYRLFVCGSTSIVDTNLVALAGDGVTSGTDKTLVFNVRTSIVSEEMPATGFQPGLITLLPPEPSSSVYDSTALELEIPSLDVHSPIVGVPVSKAGWNLTWLGNQVGWLHGTAFPSWAGNSTLTGHVYDANGNPGIFHNLKDLKWGDEVIVHVYGQAYAYEVRSVEKYIRPDDTSQVYQHEDYPWLTLVTCKDYDEESNSYRWRVVIRAVQIRID